MDFPIDIQILWPRLERLLIPWEGSASQIYVLDLPRSAAPACLLTFETAVTNLSISTLDGAGPGGGRGGDFNEESRRTIVTKLSGDTWHVLSGTFLGNRSLQLWMHGSTDGSTFDAEVVFWSDQFFDDSDDRSQNIISFTPLLSLVETFRRPHPNCQCVLTDSEVGDPRAESDCEWTEFW